MLSFLRKVSAINNISIHLCISNLVKSFWVICCNISDYKTFMNYSESADNSWLILTIMLLYFTSITNKFLQVSRVTHSECFLCISSTCPYLVMESNLDTDRGTIMAVYWLYRADGTCSTRHDDTLIQLGVMEKYGASGWGKHTEWVDICIDT